MKITRRLNILTFSALTGSVLFVPFLIAGDPGMNTWKVWLSFPLATSLAAALLSWPGLRLADKLNLPMPLLRRWEQRGSSNWADEDFRWKATVSVAGSIGLGLLVVAVARANHLPDNPGSLLVRLLTIPFGAVVPEIVAHLFLMTLLQLLTKRFWASILLSSVGFVLLFHSGTLDSLPATILVFGFNAALAIFTGWLYAYYGFEFAVLAHAIAHGVALGFMGK